jgi:hypothetical protein
MRARTSAGMSTYCATSALSDIAAKIHFTSVDLSASLVEATRQRPRSSA